MSDERVAFQMYRTHRTALVNFASGIAGNRSHAEDIVQEAWIRIEEAERTQVLERPLYYFYRIVRNLALDRRRRLALEDRYFQRDADQAASEVPEDRRSADEALITRQELACVMAALAELPERTRIAVEMHRFGGCKLKEIAEHLGISVSMAHHLIKDGVRRCQRAL